MNKNIENIVENYSVKNLEDEESKVFAAEVMEEIKRKKIVPVRRFGSMCSRVSLIGSSAAALIIAILLFNTQLGSPELKDADELMVDELLVIFSDLGEAPEVISEDETLYEDIIFAGELEQKL